MTHQRQFLPYCDRILVLKHGAEKALGTYSELASSALTELTQLQDEAEIDDAIYDQQLPAATALYHASDAREQHATEAQQQVSQHSTDAQEDSAGAVQQQFPQRGSQAQQDNAAPAQQQVAQDSSQAHQQGTRTVDSQADHSSSALGGAEAGAVQATVKAEVATAVAAAADVAGSATTAPNSVEQPNHALLVTEYPDITTIAATAVESDISMPGLVKQSQHGASATEQNNSVKAVGFTPAVVKRRKYVLPSAVDNRWGPEQRCSRLWHKLRGSGNPQTAGDDAESDAGEEEQAQLNQQEGRATGMHKPKELSSRSSWSNLWDLHGMQHAGGVAAVCSCCWMVSNSKCNQ